jgi:hypothetical protein
MPAESLGGLEIMQNQRLIPRNEVRRLKPAAAGKIINKFNELVWPPNPTSNDVSAAISAGTRQAIIFEKNIANSVMFQSAASRPLIQEVLRKPNGYLRAFTRPQSIRRRMRHGADVYVSITTPSNPEKYHDRQ